MYLCFFGQLCSCVIFFTSPTPNPVLLREDTRTHNNRSSTSKGQISPTLDLSGIFLFFFSSFILDVQPQRKTNIFCSSSLRLKSYRLSAIKNHILFVFPWWWWRFYFEMNITLFETLNTFNFDIFQVCLDCFLDSALSHSSRFATGSSTG